MGVFFVQHVSKKFNRPKKTEEDYNTEKIPAIFIRQKEFFYEVPMLTMNEWCQHGR